MEPLLEIRNVSKTFPGVRALQGVDFTLRRGEVVALVGANGAGKSTLIKIITGVYQKDDGEMRLSGEKVHFAAPSEAKRYGISTIYQELTVIPNLSVAENIFLTNIQQRAGLVDYGRMYECAARILREFNVNLDVRTKVRRLPIADQQMVEIAKAIGEEAKIFIMDEPTSALTKEENDKLFAIITSLKQKGAGIIFVSHRLHEIFEIANRVTVLRDGKVVGHYAIGELCEKRLVELLVGRGLDQLFPKQAAEIGEVVLQVENLRRGKRVQGVSFELHRGEILGLTGLLGSGRTEVARCIFGIDKPEAGRISIKGRPRNLANPTEASNAGLALVPENRKEQGLVLQLHVADNICLGSKAVSPLRDKKREESVASKFINAFNIRCTHVRQVIKNLSGGNQQKTVISKWVSRNAAILILDEPTRGIDVSAKAEVHALIGQMVRNGLAVLLISSEFDEIMGLCDRAVVLYEGKVVGILDRQNFSEERLLAYAHGHRS